MRKSHNNPLSSSPSLFHPLNLIILVLLIIFLILLVTARTPPDTTTPTPTKFSLFSQHHRHQQHKQRLIFTINYDIDSSFLTHLLQTTEDVKVYNGAEPKMGGSFLRLTNLVPLNETFSLRVVKAHTVLHTIEQFSHPQLQPPSLLPSFHTDQIHQNNNNNNHNNQNNLNQINQQANNPQDQNDQQKPSSLLREGQAKLGSSLSNGNAEKYYTYIEVNPLFAFSFYDVILSEFADAEIDVVVLRRHLPLVLKTLLDEGYFQGLPSTENLIPFPWGRQGQKFFEGCFDIKENQEAERQFQDGHDGTEEEGQVKDFHSVDAIDKLITYLLEMEARAQYFLQRLSATQANLYSVVEGRREDLVTVEGAKQFLKSLRLEFTWRTEEFLRAEREAYRKPLAVKSRSSPKSKVSLDALVARLDLYLLRCLRSNVAVPPLPHLHRKPSHPSQ